METGYNSVLRYVLEVNTSINNYLFYYPFTKGEFSSKKYLIFVLFFVFQIFLIVSSHIKNSFMCFFLITLSEKGSYQKKIVEVQRLLIYFLIVSSHILNSKGELSKKGDGEFLTNF